MNQLWGYDIFLGSFILNVKVPKFLYSKVSLSVLCAYASITFAFLVMSSLELSWKFSLVDY